MLFVLYQDPACHSHYYFYYVLSCYWQILKYLMASDRLCELGYDEAQVEEALEMFPNCESKVFFKKETPLPYLIIA